MFGHIICSRTTTWVYCLSPLAKAKDICPLEGLLNSYLHYLNIYIYYFFLQMESYAQLQERNTELEASNAQLRERNVVLENESDARDEVNKENEHELDQAII
jgi:hypothetical protein